jgi:hypothetical protein
LATRQFFALIEAAGEWAIIIALCMSTGAASGPPLSRLFEKVGPGDAAAWCGTYGFVVALMLICSLPPKFLA